MEWLLFLELHSKTEVPKRTSDGFEVLDILGLV